MLYLIAFGLFIYILIKTLKFDIFIDNYGKKPKIEKPDIVELVCDKSNNDTRMGNYLLTNYKNNKLDNEIELEKVEQNDITNVISYVANNKNKVGIANELDILSQSDEVVKNLQFMSAPQKFVLYFLIQYYQSDEYIEKEKAILSPEESVVSKDKKRIREKLDRIVRLKLSNINNHITKDQSERSNKGDNVPYIIAVDDEDTVSFKLFKTIAAEMKWNIKEYIGETTTITRNNTNTIFYKIMNFENAVKEFTKTDSTIDSMFYLRDERDWKVKNLFVNYYLINKKAPIIVEGDRKNIPKNRNSILKNTFIHKIDTSLYYTSTTVGDGEHESLSIRLPTLSVRNILFCNKNTDVDVVLLLTAICLQNLKYLQQYLYSGCKDGEKQLYLAKEMNDIEKDISELSLKLMKENLNNIQYERAENFEKLVNSLESKKKDYLTIANRCKNRILVNPFPNLDEVVFSFPKIKVHPTSKQYYHDNGLYTRNSKYEYDLNYYAKQVKEYYDWNDEYYTWKKSEADKMLKKLLKNRE